MAATLHGPRQASDAGVIDLAELIAARRSEPSWIAQLRANCVVLKRSPATLIAATTLVGRLDGRADEADLLREVADELADEAGLVAQVEVVDSSFTVRLSRRPSEPVRSHKEKVRAVRPAVRRDWRGLLRRVARLRLGV